MHAQVSSAGRVGGHGSAVECVRRQSDFHLDFKDLINGRHTFKFLESMHLKSYKPVTLGGYHGSYSIS